MKKNIFSLIALFMILVPASIRAQVLPTSPYQNPCSPMVLCGSGITTPGSYNGNPYVNITNNLSSGCMPGFYNVVFWWVNISQTGLFCFTLQPTNSCDDYDWTVYKIDPTLPCPQNLTTAIMMRSDANDIFNSPGGATGLSPTATACCCQGAGAGPAFLSGIPATAGDVYLVAICNAGTYGCPPGTQPSPVTINLDSSTATFVDTLYPRFANIEPSCKMSDYVTIDMNKPIQCSSIDPDGSDFTVSGGTVGSAIGTGCPNVTGLTSQIRVFFNPPLAPGNYVLSAQVGHDGNTLLDACDTPLKVPDTLHFTVVGSPALTYQNIITPACSEIRFPLTLPVACDSIAKDGSDFTVTGPQQVNVVAAYGIGCDSNFFSDTVVLILQKPIQTDGTYTVHSQKGSDNNTVTDTCGHRMAVGATISYNINSYDGKIKALPDSVICKPGYVNLYTVNSATPPSSVVQCGTNASATCAGTSMHLAAGSGADSQSSVHSPFYSYGKSRMQFLYPASELILTGMKAGTIRTISWNVLAHNTAFAFNNFTIKMGCTSATSMATNFLSNVQTVYNAASYTPVLGLNAFTLTTPFNWDGKSNIVVELCDDNVSSSLSADDIENSVTSYPSVYHIYSYTAASGCNMFAGAGATDVGAHYLRPKTRFGVCAPQPGTPANFQYIWNPALYLSDINSPDPRAYLLSTTTYSVMTVDNEGCAHRDSNHIIVSVRNPTLAPPDTSFCLGQLLPLRANGGIKYIWQTKDAGAIFSCKTCNNPIVTPSMSSRYYVIISDQYNCADTLSDSVTVFPTPIVKATPKDTTVFYGGSMQLRATGALYYIWSPAYNLDNPGIQAPVASPILEPISYVVYGIDEHNCNSTDTVNINVNDRSPIFVPSAFTPNRDGKNDIFRVGGITFQKVIEFRVFNRWGQQIFAEAGNSGWDGTWNGVVQDIGVYYYLIRVVSPDGYEQTFQGEVSLLR